MQYVLLIEVDADGLEEYRQVLVRQHREVAAAVDEVELRAVIGDRGPPELVVFGWSFARKHAFPLLEQLRQDWPDAHLPAIVMDTFGCARAEAAERLEGALSHISRPKPQVQKADALSVVLDELEIGVLILDGVGRVRHLGRALTEWTEADPAIIQERDAWLAHLRPRLRDADAAMSKMKISDRFELELTTDPPRLLRGRRRPIVLPEFTGILETYVDVSGERELRDLARVDGLTGLLNRRGGHEVLVREAARVQREGSSLGLALFDVDHFKRINDTCGHNVGDDVLRIIARVIDSSIRTGDVAVRWGGEEVLAVLPGADVEGARALAERVRLVVEALVIEQLGHVTLSAGVAQLHDDDAPEDAVARADHKLYEAKSSGRNCVR